jgi:hypothetical protein
MKLRVYGNSIRLRLTADEVARVAAGEPVEVRVDLSPVAMVYRLVATADVAGPTASFEGGVLAVRIPAAAARTWSASDQVGIEADVGITTDAASASNGVLRLVIEKDFQCLHGDATDQPGAYPNPAAAGRA